VRLDNKSNRQEHDMFFEQIFSPIILTPDAPTGCIHILSYFYGVPLAKALAVCQYALTEVVRVPTFLPLIEPVFSSW